MKTAFQLIRSLFLKLWRTVVSTFCKKHVYKKDVDNDQVDEIVIDLNGKQFNPDVNVRNINNKEE